MTVGLVLACASLGLGCRRSGPPPVGALQEGFREGELTAREDMGRRVFAQRCATCHGAEGRGDGQNAFNLRPAPPDFQASLGELSVDERRAVILGGTAALGRSPLCPPWGRSLREEEVEAIVAWMAVMERPSADPDEGAAAGRRRWSRRP